MRKKKLTIMLLSLGFFIASCGSSSTDVEGKKYTSVVIGKQEWLAENLIVSKFRNGDSISEVKTSEEWEKAGREKRPAWCYYNNNPDNGERYGKLYNGYAVDDPRGLAPEGWHIPTDDEWTRLTDFLGSDDAGKKMKFTDFWGDTEDGESGNGTNESGFSALPGGVRGYNSDLHLGKHGYWWSATEISDEKADYRYIFNSIAEVRRSYSSFDKSRGFSVRCVRD